MKKFFYVIYSIIGWSLTIFFLIATISYLRTPLTAICTLICCVISCPLSQKTPFKIPLWARGIFVFFFFILGMLIYPRSSEIQPINNKINFSEPLNQETVESISSNNETDIKSENNSKPNVSDNNSLKESIDEDKGFTEAQTSTNAEELSDEEFQMQCTELWHDDIFFSNNISKGNYVKLDLFVEEARFFDLDAVYVWPSSDLITTYDLRRDFFYCGVQREDEYSYVGGQINLLFSNQYECSSSDINVGDHLIVYGEVIEFSTITTDGYNYCSVIPRYIENNGQ